MTHELFWSDHLHKGACRLFDESREPLHAPCFAASSFDEARYYAETLKNEGESRPRVMTFSPVRHLRLFPIKDGGNWKEELTSLGLAPGNWKALAVRLGGMGWDGLAMHGGSSGWHVILADPGLLTHVSSEDINAPVPLRR